MFTNLVFYLFHQKILPGSTLSTHTYSSVYILVVTMSDGNPPFDMQDEFLYNCKWTKPIDDLFIDIICVQQTIGHFKVGKKNLAYIGVAIDSLSRQFGVHFTYAECQCRISKLFRRYSTFAWILSHDDFMYDPDSKYVHAPSRKWQFFIEVVIKLLSLKLFNVYLTVYHFYLSYTVIMCCMQRLIISQWRIISRGT